MIFGHLNHSQAEEILYPKALQQGLAFLRHTDFSSLPNGKHLIQGEDIFVSISEYDTEEITERKPESHEQYADIQCLISGQEKIGVSFLSDHSVVAEPYDQTRDLVFYSSVEDEQLIELTPGQFIVLFPSDVHRPGCLINQSQTVRKAVVKIRMAVL